MTPDLVLLLLIYIGVSEGQIAGALFGFFAGLAHDIYTPEHLGLNSLVKSVIGFSVGYSKGGIVTESLFVQGSLIFVASLVHDLIYFFFFSLSALKTAGVLAFSQTVVTLFLRYGVGTAVYTTCVGLVISCVFTVRLGEEGLKNDGTR
jgi:rod shape-determining protein MreD